MILLYMGKPNALCRWEDHAEGIEDDNKWVVVITLDKIRTTILITDEGDVLKQKVFNTTCLLSEADIQRLCKWPTDNDDNNAGEGQQQCRGMANNNEAWWCPHRTMWHGGWTTITCREGWQCIGRDNNNDTSQGQPTTCRGGTIGIASSDQVQRQQRRDEPVRENTHFVTRASQTVEEREQRVLPSRM